MRIDKFNLKVSHFSIITVKKIRFASGARSELGQHHQLLLTAVNHIV